MNSSGYIEKNVKALKISDYYNRDPRESLILGSDSKSNIGAIDRMLRMS